MKGRTAASVHLAYGSYGPLALSGPKAYISVASAIAQGIFQFHTKISDGAIHLRMPQK
jgi:hypothetical protein